MKSNHFSCIDQVIESANYRLNESFIKQLHAILKSGTSDSRKNWFAVGEYKRFENEVGGVSTAKPANVSSDTSFSGSKCNTETPAESGVTATNCFVHKIFIFIGTW